MKTVVSYLIVVVSLFITSNIFAQEPVTIPLGQNGTSTAWAVSPDGNKMYVADVTTLYVSNDRGASWQPLISGIVTEGIYIAGNGNIYVSGMSYPSFTAKIIRSSDNGATWQRLDSSSVSGSSYRKICASGSKVAALYTAANQKDSVVYSHNGGITWQGLQVPSGDAFPHSEFVDLDFAGDKLVITDVNGLFLQGPVWKYIPSGITVKSSAVKNGTVIMAGSFEEKAAACIYRNGNTKVEKFGTAGSKLYSVAIVGNSVFAVAIDGNNSVLYQRVSDSTWNAIGNFPFQLNNCLAIGSTVFAHGAHHIVYYDMTVSGVHQGQGQGVSNGYELEQNYPNPFNPTTTIEFTMPKSGFASIKVYNLVGGEVAVLLSEFRSQGTHSVSFNASQLSSGMYFYTFSTDDFASTKKMTLVK